MILLAVTLAGPRTLILPSARLTTPSIALFNGGDEQIGFLRQVERLLHVALLRRLIGLSQKVASIFKSLQISTRQMLTAERRDTLADGALQVADVLLKFSLLSAAAGRGELRGARRRGFLRGRWGRRTIRRGFCRTVMHGPAPLHRMRERRRFRCFLLFLGLLHLNRGRRRWNLESAALRRIPLRGRGWRRRHIDQARTLTMRRTACQKHGRRYGDDDVRSFQGNVYSNINRFSGPTIASLPCG